MTGPGALDALAWRLVLAAPPTPGGPRPGAPPGSERGEEFGKTSPIALVVVLLLGLATALLVRSMTKRLRNVPASFDDAGTGGPAREASTPPAAPDRGPAAERLDPRDREPAPDPRSDPRSGPTESP